MNNSRLLLLAAGSLCLGVLCAASAQAQVVVTVSGDQARADITLAGPGGPFLGELTLDFRDPVNLTPACLGITATLLNGAGIAAVNARMPDANLLLDAAFPVLITVEPPVACGLSFRGNYRVELRTPNLIFAAQSPYRLFKAPVGTTFKNITSDVVSGSVRARGNDGSFSEFVMVRDNAQDYAIELESAYLALEERLDDPEIGVTAMTTLLNDLSSSRAAAAAGDYLGAIAAMQRLEGHSRAFSDDGVPGQWRALRDLDNIDGDLFGLSGVVKFLLARLDEN